MSLSQYLRRKTVSKSKKEVQSFNITVISPFLQIEKRSHYPSCVRFLYIISYSSALIRIVRRCRFDFWRCRREINGGGGVGGPIFTSGRNRTNQAFAGDEGFDNFFFQKRQQPTTHGYAESLETFLSHRTVFFTDANILPPSTTSSIEA